MKRVAVYDVFLNILILASSFYYVARAVQMAKVLDDGYIRNHNVPVEKAIDLPQDYDGYAAAICFWLQPYRYSQSNSILSFSPSSSGPSTVSISLQEGNFVIMLPGCFLSLNIKPQIREWTQYCFSIAGDVKIFINMKFNSSYVCNSESSFITNEKTIYFRIGWDNKKTNPFSGSVADAKIFWRELSSDDLKNISMVDFASSGFDLLSNLPADTNSYVEITDVSEEELLEEYIPYILLYISEKDTFKSAAEACTIRRGSLPDFKKHGKETLSKLMLDFSSRSAIFFGSFWLNSLSPSKCSIGTFIRRPVDIVESAEQCNKSEISYFCVVEKQVQFRLTGFNNDNDDDVIFHPVPYTIGVFESDDVYRLYLKNGDFILKDVTTDFIYFVSKNRNSDMLIGRYEWYKANSTLVAKEMTFSACNVNSFTCSNGMCIDVKDMCQLRRDCEDFSDESVSVCEVGIPPRSFYDKTLPPSLSNYATNISIQLKLLNVLDISKEDNTLNVLLKCVLKWKDPRLEFKFLNRNYSVGVTNEIADEYWQPDLVIIGATPDDESKLSFKENPGNVKAISLGDGTLKAFDSYRALLYNGDQALVISETTVPVTIDCPMDLFYFPFDVQTCSFSLKLVSDVIPNVEWDTSTSNISMGLDVYDALYEISNFQYVFTNYSKEIQMSIKLARNYGALTFNTLLPNVALIAISIMSYQLPTHDYNDRITTVASCFVTVATMFSQIFYSLPESAEPKLINIWMYVHVLVFLQIYCGHVFVYHLDDIETKTTISRVRKERLPKKSVGGVSQKKGFTGQIAKFAKDTYATLGIDEIADRWDNFHFDCVRSNRNLMFGVIFTYGTFLLFYFLVTGEYI